MAGQPSFHADNMAPEKVPEGFASYGNEYVPDRHEESPARQERPREDQPLVENEDTISGDEVGVDEEEDEDEKLDEYAYGERVEEGDYDQRNYDIVSDDDEGLSEEEEEAELEAEERYGNGEVYDEDEDEDGEGEEEWDEDDDYESDEEGDEEADYDMSAYQPRRPVAPPPTGEPVVISLLSDSEDEDEPAPPPRKPVPATRAAPAPEPPASSEATSSLRLQKSPAVLETVETDSTETEETSNLLFGQTHVVDFAMRGNDSVNQQLRVPPAAMDADTESSSFASQVPGSFEVSSARDESYVPESDPALQVRVLRKASSSHSPVPGRRMRRMGGLMSAPRMKLRGPMKALQTVARILNKNKLGIGMKPPAWKKWNATRRPLRYPSVKTMMLAYPMQTTSPSRAKLRCPKNSVRARMKI
jgi:hypothetical protein